MNPTQILLVGVKGAVLAYHRETGEHLWATDLKSSSTGFVTVAADDSRVYAHAGGELFCLDLQTGRKLWHDGLKGFGYGIASIAFAGAASSSAAAEAIRQATIAASTATTSGASSASHHH